MTPEDRAAAAYFEAQKLAHPVLCYEEEKIEIFACAIRATEEAAYRRGRADAEQRIQLLEAELALSKQETKLMSALVPPSCGHGRPHPSICPHCLGINQGPKT